MTPPESQDPVALLHRALRELPEVPAPATLEDRVFAAIAARAALPWWRQPVTAWPAPARIGLVAASLAAAAGLTLLLQTGVRDSVAAAQAGDWLAPVNGGRTALRGLGAAYSATLGTVPPLLLYGLAAAGALSAAVLGGGIAAYRSLCLRN